MRINNRQTDDKQTRENNMPRLFNTGHINNTESRQI